MKTNRLFSLAIAAMVILGSCDENPFEELFNSGTEQSGSNQQGNNQQGNNQNTNNEKEPDFSDQDYYETDFWHRTSAQKLGLRGPVKSWYETMNGSKKSSYSLYEYDKNGNLIRETYYQNLNVESIIDYSYDAQNRVTEKKTSYSTTTYEYKNEGKMVATNYWSIFDNDMNDIMVGVSAIIEVDDQGSHLQHNDKFFSFNEDGNLVMYTHYYPTDYEGGLIGNWDDHDTIIIEYQNGLPYSCDRIKSTEYYPNGMISKVVTRSYTDGYSREVSESTYSYLNSKRVWVMSEFNAGQFPAYNPFGAHYWSINTYNEHDDIAAVKSAYWAIDTEYNNTYDRYVYDSYGNWIERNETIEPIFQHGELFGNITGRVIEYYSE